MFKKPNKTRVLFQRTLTTVMLGLFTIATILYGGFVVSTPRTALAATNNTVNFQARLQTAAGAVVPDGYYNIQFKLYSALSGGSPLWTETYYDSNGATAGNDNRVEVVNGYVSVALGSQTAFSGINFDQELYLTMNVGGTSQTASPTYDGEMDPRLKLTGVPYAFRAGQLAQYNDTTGYTSTLSLLQPTVGNQTFQIADQGAAGTYTLCVQSSTACGFAAATGGSGYIQNTTSPQTADFNITGTGVANLLQATGFDRASSGTLTIGGTNATTINIANNAVAHTINIATDNTTVQTVSLGSSYTTSTTTINSGTGGMIFNLSQGSGGGAYFNVNGTNSYTLDYVGRSFFKPTSDTAGAFQIQNAAGSTTILSVATDTNIVNICASCTLTTGSLQSTGTIQGEGGIYVKGSTTLSYTTPLGATIQTAMKFDNIALGAYQQIFAFGLPSTAHATARGFTALDARTTAHQPTLAVLSPDESNIGGFSWDGSNNAFSVKTTSNTLKITNSGDTAALFTYVSSGSKQILDLGGAGTTNGVLQFTNSTNTNVVSLQSGTTSASYITQFANSIGSSGQCLYLASVASSTQTLGYSDCLTDTTGVKLQTGTPGTAQTGHLNITGTAIASSLQASSLDTASAGALTIGGTNATSISLGQNVSVAAGKSLTLNGGNTASRPASPTEGMVYYDTTTMQLLTYANGKWQSDAKSATKIVAAGNSSQAAKDGADFVANGEASVGTGTVDGDQVQINSAISALPAGGGSVYLTEGTYVLDGSIVLPSNVKLSGAGDATIITVNNSLGAGITFVTNSDTTNGNNNITIRDIKFDGNRGNNGANVMVGISFTRVGSGTGSSALPGATITSTTFSALRGDMIYLSTANNNRITNNAFVFGASEGVDIATGSNNTVSNNTFNGVDQALQLSAATYNTISNNSIEASVAIGISVSGASHFNNFTGNSFKNNAANSSLRISTSNSNTVSGNVFADNGGSGAISAIAIAGNADNNVITGNTFRDTAGTGYAIDIQSSSADTNYISNNSLSGTGASSINDLGAGTIYGGQVNGSGNLVLQPAGTIELMKNTNITGILSATSLRSSSVDVASAGTLTIGGTTATAISIGNASSNISTTFYGTQIFKPTTGNDSATAFQIQNAGGTTLFNVNTSTSTITIGGTSNNIAFSSTGQFSLNGTARRTKNIQLKAEYSNSVLDAGTGSNNTGTMTSGLDLTNRMNYYKWTTTQVTNQSYDVVVQVPIPDDFSAWGSNPVSITGYTSNTTDGTITLEARDTGGTVRCNFVSVTPGSTSTWAANNSACTLSAGTYTAGDYMTLRIRMQSPTSGDVRIGNITLNYLSSY